GHRADRMPDQLTRAVKEERARRLIEKAEQLRKEYEEGFTGRECSVLVEEIVQAAGPSGTAGQYAAGYTPEYVYILIDPEIIAGKYPDCRGNENSMINKTVTVVPNCRHDGILWALR
ncbi:MAG: hypothetical protein HUJ76_08095, partial [Parasporobacterium sp.]|nr:hypothetical protein [Parasporobacterium sp.]